MINYEKQFYNIDNTKVALETDILSWPTETVANTKLYYNNNGNPPTNGNYPAGTTPVQTDGSTKLYRLNATSNKTGLEFVVKVMAGDRIDILGKSYYLNTTPVNNANSTALDLLGLMTNMLLGPTNPAGGKGFTASLLNTTNTGLVPATFFRGNNGETGGTVPKAYINYLLFDEQFKYVGGNFSRAGTSGVVKNHFGDVTMQNISVTKNGYIFVYVSNESNLDVFFDNLQVIHTRGAILEETHYYPFGLTMAGISSKALNNSPTNRFKYNGIEQNTDLDLNIYDAFYRNLDPQIGRFWQIDPKPIDMFSPYAAMANNPILYSDPLGDTTWVYGQNGALMGIINDKMKNQVHFMDNDGKGTFDGSKLTAKQSKAMANAVRKTSIAFMGSKTANDMKSISDKSTAADKEIAFVGSVGKDREIRLTAMPIDENNFRDQVNVGSQLDKNYPNDQGGFFLYGHVHHGGLEHSSDRSPMGIHRYLADLSNDDYDPALRSTGEGSARRQSPAVLTTPYGFTIYGTGTGKVKVGEGYQNIYPNRVIPTNDSHVLYKSLKR
ncbi:MAG: hypothetical protein KF746_27220 [Chitinophagaceae bacterium]|nr:hypothetical protein [Chitinophagaceae bacterium]